MRVVAVVITVLMLAYPASAWTGDEDWDAQILQAIEDSKTWGMIESVVDSWTAEDMWGLVESIDIPPISPATRAAIRDRLAVDNRIPDNRFTHMPQASEWLLIHLIVDACIIAVLILIGYVAPYVVSSTSVSVSSISIEEEAASGVRETASEIIARLEGWWAELGLHARPESFSSGLSVGGINRV